MDRPRIAIVIPALNEAATIARVVEQVRDLGLPIVVDDGSSDDTGAIAKRAGADVVRHVSRRGYDGALNSGFLRASELDAAIVVTMDADGQHRAEMLPRFAAAIDSGSDVAAGIRDRKQRFAEWLFAGVTSLRWGIRDPLCGFKAYRMSLYREVGHFDSYESIGTELLLTAAHNHFKVTQIEVPTANRADAPRFGRVLRANLVILRAMVLALVRIRRLPSNRSA